MGKIEPPFLYDPVKVDPSRPQKEFDPKAVTRASFEPKQPRPKQEGPLVTFNQHPDSYMRLPTRGSGMPMDRALKKRIKIMRIAQWILRCFELVCAIGLLILLILIKGMDTTSGWIMRIAPGIAMFHSLYGIYHLSRSASGRTPASTASYMLFASFFDTGIIPFYAYTALLSKTKETNWTTILSNQAVMPTFVLVIFYAATVGGGLHLISLIDSLYLAVQFRKIASLPPDMNPLEDNLTSRHKRNKSSISTVTTMSEAEKRLSQPLESKRSSGAVYEDLSRPPAIPFFHTRSNSTESFSTYKSTPPPSRDSRLDLPSRQYQIPAANSNRSSVVELKRASLTNSSKPSPPSKRGSYAEIPAEDDNSPPRSRPNSKLADGWYANDSLTKKNPRSSRSASPKKASYQVLTQDYYDEDDLAVQHPSPLELNPPTPRSSKNFTRSQTMPLEEGATNRRQTMPPSGDLGDMSARGRDLIHPPEEFKSKYYGDLQSATPPVMVGAKNSRQISSGNDFLSSFGKGSLRGREVSGKVAEEGRGGPGNGNGNTWGTRLRRISGRFSGQ
ncbi:hypothetical protein F5884DRAFT_425173 [Xylogone sp. PMI_703]|nr:hypothetical protein F5884DRAFT_425173 [Xylogone sp. PMI_703]